MKLHLDGIHLRLGDASFTFNAEIESPITGIFGLSGAGKSTLMRVIAGLESPDKGRLVFNDRVFCDAGSKQFLPPNKRRVGLVFQEHNLFPHLSVEKNLRYSAPYLKGRRVRIDFDTVVELLELRPLLQKMPVLLSGGERQRVAIGRALLSQPELLLMDEPFSNLDRDRRGRVTSYLLEIAERFDIPMLIISHDLEDILKLTRSFIIVEDKTVRATGSYLEIADRGELPGLVSYKRFVNTPELRHVRFDPDQRINYFRPEDRPDGPLLTTNFSAFADPKYHGRRVRLCIFPDDIALSKNEVRETSIQNQLLGTVTKVRTSARTSLVTIDCGIPLTAEITEAAKTGLGIVVGTQIYCLIKAKAIEVIHIFGS